MVLLFASSIRQVCHLPSLALCSRNLPPGRRGLFLNAVLDTMLPEKTAAIESNGGQDVTDTTRTQLVSDDATPTAAVPPRPDYPWRRAKKVAAMLSFSGKDYFGMQRNPGMRTIEEELMAAFRHYNPHSLFLWRVSPFGNFQIRVWDPELQKPDSESQIVLPTTYSTVVPTRATIGTGTLTIFTIFTVP